MVSEIINLSEVQRLSALEWQAANFDDSRVSLDYWRGAVNSRNLTPMNAMSRVRRLGEYLDLYRGDMRPLSMLPHERLVSGSEFARVADTYARLLMAYPPTFEGIDEEFDTDRLIAAINEVVLDMVRYGTGLLYSYPPVGTDIVQGGVVRLDPRNWFPAGGDDRAAYVITDEVLPDDGSLTRAKTVGIQLFTIGLEERLFGYSDDGVQFRLSEASDLLPTVLEHEEFPVQVCALPPISEGWGVSFYEGMVRLVAELSRRMSSTSIILGRHAAPHLQAVRDDRAGQFVAPTPDGDNRAQLLVTSASLDEVSQQTAFVPPRGTTRLEYLTWDGNLDASFRQRDAMLDELAAVTSLPSALYGVLRGGGVPTGASLRRQYAMTHTTIEAIQTVLIPRIQTAIRLAGGGDDVIVQWLNPIDELDVMTVRMQGEDDDDDDVRTGEALSEDVADDDVSEDTDDEEDDDG